MSFPPGGGIVRRMDPPPATSGRAWPEGFEVLYREQYAPMVRLAVLLVGSTEPAEELVQDAFIRVRRRWSEIEHHSAYLRVVVVNGCRSHHRRRALERRRLPEPDIAQPGAPDEMWDAIAALPFRQRAVVTLRFYEDLPEAEIAAALGCPPGTVASTLHRALARLRQEVPR